MIIGVPKEIKLQEHRIGLTPESVKALTDKKHKVLVQDNGGFEAGFTNEDYLAAGAKIIKTAEEIEKMRVAGRLAADVLHMIEPHVVPGITTQKLNDICHDFMVNEQKVVPAPLNYRGFPRSICTSVNHVVCHGIPAEKKLKAGDIINIDVTVILQRPKLSPHKAKIKANLAALLGCELSQVNLKGKTHEKVDSLGENRSIACHVVVLVTSEPQA